MQRSRLRRIEKIVFYVVLCVGVAMLLKWKVVEGYSIPTSSMEPTLMGDPLCGDKVAVFKPYFRLFNPRRFELAVFRREDEPEPAAGPREPGEDGCYVKRLVGLPGETIQIENGEIYLGSDPPRLAVKPLQTVLDMLIPVYRADFGPGFFGAWQPYGSAGASSAFRLENGGLLCDASDSPNREAELAFAPRGGAVLDDYLTDEGLRPGSGHPVNDLALHVEVEFLEDRGVFYGELREAGDTFRFELRSRAEGGGGEVYHLVGRMLEKRIPLKPADFPGFVKGCAVRLSFLNVDDRLDLLVDGKPVLEDAYDKNTHLQNASGESNAPLFGVRGARVLVRSLGIDRDVYYTSDRGYYAVREPFPIPKGNYFFLGDNSGSSEDSRTFGPVPEEDLAGKPFLIFFPWRRFRLL